MKYGAITIDTSIFDRYALAFTSHPLKSLEQFANKPAGLVLSEIVIRELRSHLSRKIEEHSQSLRKALKNSSLLDLDSSLVKPIGDLLNEINSNELAEAQLKAFSDATRLKIVVAENHVKLGDLIRKYFDSKPPFAESGQKKSEFPDAICLMSLEAYAKEKNFKIIAVSEDKDWKSFADQSDWIDVEPEFSKAISSFQPQTSAYSFCSNFICNWDTPRYEPILADITNFVERATESMDVAVNAESGLHWEADDISVTLESFEIITNGDAEEDIKPIQINEFELTFAVSINVICRANAEFSLSAYDSIDKDYVRLGGCSDSTDFEFQAEMFVSLSGDLDGNVNDLEVDDVEISVPHVSVDFGYLEPDWHDEDYA
ncbi:PIN domain-containing protein [Xanthomonas cannabis]|uniref:PIN domain-containing protein n=1 Tax=Xanthomonas cannabis TaxID=1885674 RepID=UPI0033AF70BF